MSVDYPLIAMYITAIIIFLGTPGPVAILVANSSIKGGISAGCKTIIGTNVASIVLISISFLVIQGVFSTNETALALLTLLGSFYLLYFAIDILRSKVSLETSNITKDIKTSWFRNGFLIGISNPKDILFFMAFFPAFFHITDNTHASMAILLLIWVVLDYALLSLLSFTFTKVSKQSTANLINKCSGVILLIVASYALYSSIDKMTARFN